MDITQAAKFFNQDQFDAYDFLSASWALKDFQGKIKYAPESFSVNDLASRKRMLFTAPDNPPTSSVVRVNKTNQIFLIEGNQPGLFKDTPYLNVYNVHECSGPAQIWRLAPTGPSNNPGWAANTKIEDTFSDAGFDRVPTDQESIVNQYGLYTLYFPSDSTVRQHDTVVLQGETYFLFDVFVEQGLKVARATNKPDPRRNIVYISVNATAYDPTTLTPGQTTVSYNITAQVEPTDMQETADVNVIKDSIKILIDSTWIGVVPKVNDKVQVFSKTYRVMKLTRNPILDQWEIYCCV
jgi:hypothetical protein